MLNRAKVLSQSTMATHNQYAKNNSKMGFRQALKVHPFSVNPD
jgi:hypothetical protein